MSVRIAGSNCNCGRHKLIGDAWYAWGPRGKQPLKTVPSCMPLPRRDGRLRTDACAQNYTEQAIENIKRSEQ